MKLPWWKVVLYMLAAPVVLIVFMIMHPVKVWEAAKKEWYK